MPFTTQDWIDRFVTDLADVIGAIGGEAATAGPWTVAPADGWVVVLRAEQGSQGELAVEFDRIATEALAKRIMAMDTDPPHPMVVDTLKELCAQTAGSMVLAPPLVGVKLAIASIARASEAGPGAVLAQITVADAAPLALRMWGDIALVDSPRVPMPVPAPAMPARPAPSLPVSASSDTPPLDLILDIDLPLTIRFGQAEMPLRVIAALGPGSVIDLGRSPDDPVDVLVGNQLVARGEVVIVGGNYGVRITELINPAPGIRSLEDRF